MDRQNSLQKHNNNNINIDNLRKYSFAQASMQQCMKSCEQNRYLLDYKCLNLILSNI